MDDIEKETMKNDKEKKLVLELNEAYKELSEIIPYHYGEIMPTFSIRGTIKSLGWRLYSIALDKKDYNDAAHFILHHVIWSHYWRCREDLEKSKRYCTNVRRIVGKQYFKGYRLEIDHYTRNWLYANGNRLLIPEVMKSLDEFHCYRPEKNKLMPHGMTYYTLSEQK
tara:strand:+ start:168 stop:668 length:501 start_codon:yes stop_codon:yes gene_type:complete